jgi:tetratricopeptide (TPR) repeat protein
MLDAAEYLHLAIHSSQENNHHAALNYLNEALKLEPENASVLYFLAAEHAELGLFERALKEMEQALNLDASMDIARLQYGLLSLQLGQKEGASQAFEYLTQHSADESLKHFSSAYLSLFAEDIGLAGEKISAGIRLSNNPALIKDMERVLDSLSAPGNSELKEPEAPSALYLGAYRDQAEG